MWDGRVALQSGQLETPLGSALPAGLTGPLAAQVLLPVTARIEMRGQGADELAAIPDSLPGEVFTAVMARLRAIPGYDTLFTAAFPGTPVESLTIADAANAIAAFVGDRWRADDSPFDRYLRGDTLALDDRQLGGATLFFGRARCGACHRGPLLTDQEFHNTGVPALGPGLLNGGPDIGRAGVTLAPTDQYRFRTPPLRNVALTAPYMHNGSFQTLEGVVRHYRNVQGSLLSFDPETVDSRLRSTLDLSPERVHQILTTVDPRLLAGIPLSDRDVSDLVAFLEALTDPASAVLLGDVPATVPSGLSVFDR
jgi:cytochrome c peroxidase